MLQATVKELRLRTKALLAATARGEIVEITYRGKPCARLSGPEESAHSNAAHSRNPAFGLWADHNHDSVDDQVRRLRQPRHFDSPT